ncbi:hypothetical protein [Psychroflexus sp. ALD_RP9]|uniref:hypothetical protein n=1 Tax=Psychroflexus sp. ALD_RP9 TaxID=2777186 RepID=UPI001A8ED45E|nr:hypothetical protein [Psychroflexus sp. ALD_RP9]
MSFAQNYFEGKIIADSLENYQINIVNITNKQGTTTRKNGRFSIPAEVNDSVVFSSVKHEFAYRIVKASDFNQVVEIPLKVEINELPEVILNSYDLTGDVAKDISQVKVEYIDQKARFGFSKPRRLSPVQRQIYAVQTSGPLALMIMQFNGQMASLKRRIKYAQEQRNQQLVLPFITDSLMVNFFKLDLMYKDDFAYYCAEDSQLLNLVRQNDRLKIMEAIKAKVALYRKSKYNLKQSNE